MRIAYYKFSWLFRYVQTLKKERNPKKYIQDVITFLWREALAAEEVLKVDTEVSYSVTANQET